MNTYREISPIVSDVGIQEDTAGNIVAIPRWASSNEPGIIERDISALGREALGSSEGCARQSEEDRRTVHFAWLDGMDNFTNSY